MMVLNQLESAIIFLDKKIDIIIGDLEKQKQMWLILRFSEKKILNSACSVDKKEYILDNFGSKPEISSIV